MIILLHQKELRPPSAKPLYDALYDLEQFGETFDATLSKHAPYRFFLIRGENKPHTTKPLQKEVMK